jgi:hypothetical protein
MSHNQKNDPTSTLKMSKSKASNPASAPRATLKPARVADAQLDHLEHMILSFAKPNAGAPLGCLDQSYWRRRLASLADESDLVSAQRARVIRLLDILDQSERHNGPKQHAA